MAPADEEAADEAEECDQPEVVVEDEALGISPETVEEGDVLPDSLRRRRTRTRKR